jgi:carboxymethylenebutenolidase
MLSFVVALFVASLAFAADIPPAEDGAKEAINKSPRHGEFVDIAVPKSDAKVKAFVVYPERKEKAPVVIVIHEIFGLSDWVRGVADQLAADGYIAIAPDLLSGKGPNGGGTDAFPDRDAVTKAVRGLADDEVAARLDAVRAYGLGLPAAAQKSATIGFCWGGATSFKYATKQPQLNAAIVYYGTAPSDGGQLAKITAPVLGLYGGKDGRVTQTTELTETTMKGLNKPYEKHVYEGAGHGFLRQQDGQAGANAKASREGWKETLAFLKKHLEG